METKNKERPIHNRERFNQSILFKGCEWGKKAFTDLDAGFEFNDTKLLFTEIKYIGQDPQIGQDILIRRILDAWEESNKWVAMVKEQDVEIDRLREKLGLGPDLNSEAKKSTKNFRNRTALGLRLTHRTPPDQDVELEKCNVQKEYHPHNGEWTPTDDFYKFGEYQKKLFGKIWKIPK